ncbi:uncharacterized protein LOC143878723 [Tasmannia lanceolata]|uniref:uncharacterized protein LOC143878723 n=1 Tax=Tasmannia lanceolata TaxID=3420 RepID=UPI004063DEE3
MGCLHLLGKWLWRFGEEQSNLWAKVICSKYGCIPGGWESKDEYKKKGLTAWRDILKLACSFNLKVRFRVYGGDRIKFWSDVWCEEEQLRILFPRLYRVAVNKEAFVCECFDRSGGKLIWCPAFRRILFEWESEDESRLRRLFNKCYVKRGGQDKRIWTVESSGIFSVKSFYNGLMPPYVPAFSAKDHMEMYLSEVWNHLSLP